MPAPRKFSDEVREQLLSSFHSDKSGPEIAKQFGYDFHRTLRKLWLAEFGEEVYRERISRLCRQHKVGTKNPMYGKSKEQHHRYKPVHKKTNGYVHVEVPSWYTGPVDKGKVAEHILIACEAAGLTELPEFHVVHHKDENKKNNHPSNLEIMSRGKHMVTHRWLRHQKKVQRLSRKRVEPK